MLKAGLLFGLQTTIHDAGAPCCHAGYLFPSVGIAGLTCAASPSPASLIRRTPRNIEGEINIQLSYPAKNRDEEGKGVGLTKATKQLQS